MIIGAIYTVTLMFLIVKTNNDSMIYYKISPYVYASDPIDFFFALIVTIPFSFYTFFLKKDGFLEYVQLRMPKKRYLFLHIVSMMVLCFTMVFIVNLIGIIFSCMSADVITDGNKTTLAGYILGEMQMTSPIIFGILWSLQKAFVGMLICLFAQVTAIYIENLFLALITPFIYVVLENYATSVLHLSQFSLTTTFVLNRLKPRAMTVSNILIGVLSFIAVIIIVSAILRRRETHANL